MLSWFCVGVGVHMGWQDRCCEGFEGKVVGFFIDVWGG